MKKQKKNVWLCESVGKLKGVGHWTKAKMNELRIHTIDDLQIHVRHHGIPKVPIRGSDQFYDMVLQDLPGKPLLLSRTTGKQKICIFQDMESYGWKN